MKQAKFEYWDKVTDGKITGRVKEAWYCKNTDTYKYLLYNASEMYYYPGMFYEDQLTLVSK